MKICITGGLGFLGSSLCRSLSSAGYKVTAIERSLKNKKIPDTISVLEADTSTPGQWQEELLKQDIIINLAGANIFQRWNKKTKEIIYNSRIETTKNIVNTLNKRPGGKITLLNASAVGYYGFSDHRELDERNLPGKDFLAKVSSQWEKEAVGAENEKTRVVLCRFGIILGKEGGAFPMLEKIFRLHMGCKLGSGKQWFSWIHQKDLERIFDFLIKNPDIRGPVNCTSPGPVTNKDMSKSLRNILKKPALVPFAPGFAVKILLGELGSVLLNGQRVIPRKLVDSGFYFEFPDFEKAVEELLN